MHQKDNKLRGINCLENMLSLCMIYTIYIKGHFRLAKCLNNSIHANKRGQRAVKRERVAGGRKLALDQESQIW